MLDYHVYVYTTKGVLTRGFKKIVLVQSIRHKGNFFLPIIKLLAMIERHLLGEDRLQFNMVKSLKLYVIE